MAKLFKRIAWLGFTAVFVYFVIDAFTKRLYHSTEAALVPGPSSLISAFLIFIIWLITFELAWEWVFRRTCVANCRIGWSRTGLAFFQSMLARYIPGKVWYLAARTESLVSAGIPRTASARSVLYEQAHYLCATLLAALLISPLLLVSFSPEVRLGVLHFTLGAVGVIVWLFLPHRLFAIVNRVLSLILPRRNIDIGMPEGRLLHWQIAFAMFIMVVVCQAIAIYPLVRGLLPPSTVIPLSGWIVILGAYPVARLIGQLSIVSPSGLGVREGAYVVLVLSVLGSEVSTVVAVWARLISISAEIFMFTLFLFVKFFHQKSSGP